ncbi:MAG: serine hydrolase [Flavobacteriaceae bacterium]|nr:serine hydrolase [Flavobacteriaceae bacterium]|tara:strand:+ start:12849 stop:13967 length:1119 start_codon:yes stop_codon:yes gene_type:complete
MRKFLKTVLFIILVGYSVIYVSGYGWFLEGVTKIYLSGHTTSYLSDYEVFENNLIPKSTSPQPWPIHKDYNLRKSSKLLENYHLKTKSVAFLIIKNDSLFYEKYFDNYNLDSKSNSFSMAKSFVSALLGKAIMDGYVESLDQPVYDFLPELKGSYAKKVTMGDLSSMASGMDWQEDYYSPFSVTASAYFIDNLSELILNQKIISKPGQSFEYLSGATQLLGMALIKATGKTLSRYLYESFWEPMGAEKDAFWQVDRGKNGVEKTFCCLASNARDFARLGKLYKDFGRWNNKKLLDSTFINKSIMPRFEESPNYGYSWWLQKFNGDRVFRMQGHLGQYVFVYPQENLIVVRLGHLKGKDDINIYLNEGINMTR